ncbi:hypothetical protein OIU79_025007 [Salix purpurea]|uniref:Uncharacterized protein n=1 Tax=Salix purpurea TaxID=77065 RepID=A0A9Q0W3W9_SALPP|nr:hypothetical protein OIU79_025007 [Salix purpurea]
MSLNLICGALYVEEHGKNRWTKLFAIPIDHDKLTNLKRVFFLSRLRCCNKYCFKFGVFKVSRLFC